MRWLIAGIGIGVLLTWAWWQWPPPSRWNPWASLNVNDQPNALTPYKMMRLRADPQLCAAALATSGLTARAQADSPAGQRCPLQNVLRVSGGPVSLSSSFLATCPLAVAFALFERHGLQPAALAAFNSRVTRVEHLGSFACRNVYGRSQGRLSEHASANALDIAGFRLANGRHISVLKDWTKGEEGAFLRQARDAACQAFSTVLSPDYNAAHRNHLHLDMGGWSVCR
jgi:hypothetical protein